MQHSPAFEKICEDARSQIKEIDVASVNNLLSSNDHFTLIDVREDHEWDKGHLPQAHHLGRGILERDIEKICPDKDAQIILYCGGGYRSALAALNLKTMGYTHALSMAKGFRGWVDAGLPLENT